MKVRAAFTAIPIVLAACAFGALLGVDRHRSVDADEFIALVTQGPDSMQNVEFIGARGGRAYLACWRRGVVGGDSMDIVSVDIDDLPQDLAGALRNGHDPWQQLGGTNDPGIRPEEWAALRTVTRHPPEDPVVVILRCEGGKPASVARAHFDHDFTGDGVVPIPVPSDCVLVVTVDEETTVSTGGEQSLRAHAGETVAIWLHAASEGAIDVSLRGSSSSWQVQLRCVAGALFYNPGFDTRKRTAK